MSAWDHEYDVVVVGSGAGGMTAALSCHDKGLKTLLIEKDRVYGGTTAVSGGGIWIPCNHQVERKGGSDDLEAARAYVHALTRGDTDPARVDTYLDTGPSMVKYLEDRFGIEFDLVTKYPDYFMHTRGSKATHRSMEPAVFDAKLLGDELENQRDPYPGTLIMNRMSMTQAQAHTLLAKEKGWVWMFIKMLLGYWLDIPWRFKTQRDRRLKLGQALVASLRHAMLNENVPLWLECGLEDLVEEDGRIVGVVASHKGKQIRIAASKGVILASGGFEANQAMRDKYLPQPTKAEWSAAPGCNHGEGIEAGIRMGAAVKDMDRVWGAPSIVSPVGNPATALFVERALPRAVMVNNQGKRFVNEAGAYTAVVYAMLADHAKTGGTVPCWFVADAVYRKNYPMGPVLPGMLQPDSKLPPEWRNVIYYKADSLEELAGQIGVDAAGLKQTVQRFNGFAEKGVDEDFGKGDNEFDRYYGDSNVKPNPCLGPIEKPPFYAVKLFPGEIGTNGGLDADPAARVKREDGGVIPGLYAVGNCSTAVMGRSYPGAGSTLGPAMVYGYLAAQDIAAAENNGDTNISNAA
ncbi:MAG: FAD-dependent oxidoreductase [Salinisphaeraceae bacterium]|nr:FAD-dependent oxidoreductase [Salinisphaeraceae bacterium]